MGGTKLIHPKGNTSAPSCPLTLSQYRVWSLGAEEARAAQTDRAALGQKEDLMSGGTTGSGFKLQRAEPAPARLAAVEAEPFRRLTIQKNLITELPLLQIRSRGTS